MVDKQYRASGRWLGRTALGLVLGLHGLLLGWSAVRHSPTSDEAMHLAAGLRRVLTGRFDLDLGNPPLAGTVAAIPVAAARPATDWGNVPWSFAVGEDFALANGPRTVWLLAVGRWACIPFSMLGGYVCFCWARAAYGEPSGWLSLVLWCACPNILAHGALVTADVAAMSLGIAACYVFWRWLQFPVWGRAVVAGVVLGLAELAKYVWAPLYLLCPLVWLTWACGKRRDAERPSRRRQAAQLTAMLALSVYVINVGYLFDRTCEPLIAFRSGVRILRRIGAARDDSPLRWLQSVPVPLPASFVRGIEEIEERFDRRYPSYFHGRWSDQRFWYYYVAGLGLKIPLGTLTLILLAGGLSVADRRYNVALRTDSFLLAVALGIFVFVSVVTSDQRHVRYVLPALPFLFVWASKTARALTLASWRVAAPVGLCVVWSVISSLSVFPHSLSYFNELAGGSRRGHDWLVDSNIDSGQDLLYLKRWLDAHPDAPPLHLAYFGFLDPRVAGIKFTLPPTAAELGWRHGGLSDEPTRAFIPGWYAISVNLLRGMISPIADGGGGISSVLPTDYTYFLRFKPVEMAGYSIYIYHLEQCDIDSLKIQMGARK